MGHAMRTLSHVTLQRRPVTMNEMATVAETCDRMRNHHAGIALVTNDAGNLVGVFTGRDAVCRVVAQRRDPSLTRLAEVMTRDPVTMSPDQSASDALALMRDGGFRHVPLVRNGRIMGVAFSGEFTSLGQSRDDEEERGLSDNLC
jgi:CBS domain-containing protein